MKITDATTIAWTKFKARKVRTIVSSIITAIMLVILISISLAYTGNRNSLKNVPGLTSEKAIAFVSEVRVFDFGDEPIEEEESSQPTLQEVQTEYPGYNITKVYEEKYLFNSSSLGNLIIDGKEIEGFNGNNFEEVVNISFNSRSDELLTEQTDDNQKIDIGSDGSIPAYLTPSILLAITDKNFEGQPTKERVENIAKLVDSYRGKVIAIEQKDVDSNPLLLRVVGFVSNDSFLFPENKITIPASVLSDTQLNQINSLRENGRSEFDELQVTEEQSASLYEFTSKEDLKRFVLDNSCNLNNYETGCTDTRVIQDALFEFDQELSVLWSLLKYVVGFFFIVTAVFLFFTTSKVIGESRRETGVFRAIGAKRLDIAKIYIIYTIIITSLAYIIGLVFSIILMTYITIVKGPELSVSATNLTGNYNDIVNVTFIGFDFVQLLGILMLAIAAGLIGGIIPIVRNVMIDPIKAMRTE